MTVPAHAPNGVELRPAQTGPVFSVNAGALHMRYHARTPASMAAGRYDAVRSAIFKPHFDADIAARAHAGGWPWPGWSCKTCCTTVAAFSDDPTPGWDGSSIAPDILDRIAGDAALDARPFTKKKPLPNEIHPLKFIQETLPSQRHSSRGTPGNRPAC